ncbi:MAG: PD-(D/E)XK nuclease family protein [Thiohalorhabdus sp.]
MNSTEQAEAIAELYTGQPAAPAADEVHESSGRVVRVRASSWGALFDCAHRWEGVHLLGMRNPSRGRARLGQALHASTAAYDQARMEGSDLTPDDAAGAFVDTLYQEDEEPVEWSDISRRQAERIGLPLHTKYCLEVSPRYEFRAVEMALEPLDINVPSAGVTVRLTGTMDRSRVVASGDGRLTIGDVKTGQRAVGANGKAVTQGHHLQLGVYDLTAEYTLQQETTGEGEIIGLQATDHPRIGTGHIEDVRTPLVGTDERPGLIEMAADMFRSGLFYPNPKSVLCTPDYCPRHRGAGGDCLFHD